MIKTFKENILQIVALEELATKGLSGIPQTLSPCVA
jgi:hypothetical protein